MDTRGRLHLIAAGTIGNILEWYDFAVYGYFAAHRSDAISYLPPISLIALRTFSETGPGMDPGTGRAHAADAALAG
jgi:hypothetical protein